MKKSEDMKRLHALSVIFFIGKTIKDLLYPLIVFFVTTIFRENVNYLWLVGGVALFLILLILISVLTWLRFTYAIEPGGLRVEHGILVRKKLWIGRERVQSVDTSAGILHRMFGLKKLQVETAGGKKPEAVLNGITSEEGLRISRGLGMSEAERGEGASNPTQETTTASLAESSEHEYPGQVVSAAPSKTLAIRKLGLGDLVMFSATSGKIGVVLAVAVAAISQLSDWLEQTFDVWGFISEWYGSKWVVLLVLLLLALAWLLAFIGSFVKEYGFTLQLREDKLVIERGLLERNQITVPLRRIQAVHLIEPLLRRPFGWVTVHIVTAGYAGKEGQSALLFPFIRKKELPGFLEQFAPQFQIPDTWERLERRALRHYVLLPMAVTILICIPAVIWVPSYYGWFSLIVPVVTLISSLLAYRQTGWALSGEQISIQHGSFNKHQGLIPRRRVQWHRVSQSIFQRRRSLAHLSLALASGASAASFSIRHASQRSAESLSSWLSLRRQEQPEWDALEEETHSSRES